MKKPDTIDIKAPILHGKIVHWPAVFIWSTMQDDVDKVLSIFISTFYSYLADVSVGV